MTVKLTKATVLDVKRDLWASDTTQALVAAKYGITQTTISRIASGLLWGNVPWPDGSQGPMPERRALVRQIDRAGMTRSQFRDRVNQRVESELKRLRNKDQKAFDRVLRRILKG